MNIYYVNVVITTNLSHFVQRYSQQQGSTIRKKTKIQTSLVGREIIILKRTHDLGKCIGPLNFINTLQSHFTYSFKFKQIFFILVSYNKYCDFFTDTFPLFLKIWFL